MTTNMDNETNITDIANGTDVPHRRNRKFWTKEQMMLDIFLNQDNLVGLFLSLVTMGLNILSLVAINHKRKGLSTNMRLVTSLSTADLMTGLSVFSHVLHKITAPAMTPARNSRDPRDALPVACTLAFIFGLYAMSILAELLTLTVMTIDHYLAILKPLHHLTRFSKHNCNLLIYLIWLLAILGGFSAFLYGLIGDYNSKQVNYCEHIQLTEYNVEYLVWAVAILSMIIISYTYIAICCKVCEINRNNIYIQRGYSRNRKGMMTTLIIVGTFLLCWLPTCIFQIVLIQKVKVNPAYVRRNLRLFKRLNVYLNYLLLMNSVVNPIVYAFRLREIQQRYSSLFNRCFCCRRIVNYYRSWVNDVSSNLSTEANSYVYYRQRSAEVSTKTNQSMINESNIQAKLLHKYQAPLRVTFTKNKSSSYDYTIYKENHTIPCSVKIYTNQTPLREKHGYLYMKCQQSKEKSDEKVQVLLIPKNKHDNDLLSTILQNNNLAVCKYRHHIANTKKGTTRLELDKIHIYYDEEGNKVGQYKIEDRLTESML